MSPTLALRRIPRILRDAGWIHRQDQVISVLPDGSRHGWGRVTKTASSKAREIWAVEDIGPSTSIRRSHTEPWHSGFGTIPIHTPGNSGLPGVATKDADFPSHQRSLEFSNNQNKSTGQQQSAGVFPDLDPLIKRRVNRLQLDIRGSKDQGYTRAWGNRPIPRRLAPSRTSGRRTRQCRCSQGTRSRVQPFNRDPFRRENHVWQ
ncbi:hypothetical protein CPLU01_02999 [Colletotrichum plurivorum]|uniref:Uncharacterized protein n=1 Tax=Colletotrichum plurivorum TaxID=2175906 RepID=A0A8H6NMA3_9PEZI|nr:hypothetical protein CPLU01_02999 [Colletotrichum plurivorum]